MQPKEEQSSNNTCSPWWQPTDMRPGECWHLGVGTLSVYVQYRADQWLIATKEHPDNQENYAVIRERLEQLPEDVTASRFVFRQAPNRLRLVPRSLDRPVVVKTEQPVQVPPGENIVFYISSPVCVSVELPQQPLVLQETPTLQLSDTWFGPSTQVGAMCYAARTHARNSRADVPLRPHRAVTPVTVSNRTEGFLAIERLSIPVPLLALYGAADGSLWTDPVILTQLQDHSMISFAVGKDKPDGELISPAREDSGRGGLIKAISSIFAIS